MKNTINLHLRQFPVTIQDNRTGELTEDTITLDKSQLHAAQIVGQSSEELIFRLYNRKGFRVMEVGKPRKLTVAVELGELVEEAGA